MFSLVVIITGSLLYNIPRLFELESFEMTNRCTNKTETRMTRTPFGKHRVYIYLYKVALRFFVRYVIPLGTIIVLNTFIVVAIRRGNKQRSTMSHKDHRENRTTMTLVIICALYAVCQTPSFVSVIATNLYHLGYIRASKTLRSSKFTAVANLFLTLNSSLNFVVYAAVSQTFRRTVRQLLRCRRGFQVAEAANTTNS